MSVKGNRNWTFTLNNYTAEQYEELCNLPSIKYVIIGKEPGGTPHLQGFVAFQNAKTLSALKKINGAAHFEEMFKHSNAAKNRLYCSKGAQTHEEYEELGVKGPNYGRDADVYERGVCPMDQKAKGDSEKQRWAHIIKLSEAGDWDALKEEYPEVYGPRLKCLQHINKKRPRDLSIIQGELEHEWIVGPTGCGKSGPIFTKYPDAYVKNPNVKWWCDYNGEEVAIIDDFDKFQVKQGGDMKRWLDRYPFQAEFKGGMEKIRPRKIIVTSQYTPEEIWDDQKTVDAILRRVKVITLAYPPPVVDTFVPHPSD